jgi:O-acetyl-ADP-ribose deacetylase (regulator of RNase III)
VLAFDLRSLTLEVADGDLAAERVDAVVNAANNHFWMGAGVAGALKARGGVEIEADAMAQGPVDPGACVITAAGRLPARHVIHAAVMGQDLRTSSDLIARATMCSLALAETHRLTSIAFPALGTGVGGFPLERCARIMIDAIRDHEATSLRLVRLILFGDAAYRAVAAVAGERLGTPLDGAPDCPISG